MTKPQKPRRSIDVSITYSVQIKGPADWSDQDLLSAYNAKFTSNCYPQVNVQTGAWEDDDIRHHQNPEVPPGQDFCEECGKLTKGEHCKDEEGYFWKFECCNDEWEKTE